MNLLLAVVLPVLREAEGAQASSPEETLRKIEQTLDQAKTLQLKFTRRRTVKVLEEPETVVTQSGTVLAKGGNKVFAEIDESSTASSRVANDKMRVISDGKKILSGSGILVSPKETSGPPPSIQAALARSLTRGHVVTTLIHAGFQRGGRPQEFRIFGVQAGPESGSLAYKMEAVGTKTVADVTLWYDPATHKPLKRRVSTKTEFREEVSVDTVDELLLDVDHPDWKFDL